MEEIYSNINENGVATVTLNNPKALNSINLNMVQLLHKQLKEWENNDEIKLIIMEGSGDRAFSAGGDIKSLYTANVDKKVKQGAVQFFSEEYVLDAYIAQYPKPIIANLDGIVMGGGVGLAYHADYRIVSEKTKWAMPEMNLGFFPDVGAGYFLNKAPGYVGRYLALTGNIINGKEAIYINAADYLLHSDNIANTIEKIHTTNWADKDVRSTLTKLFEAAQNSSILENNLATHEASIEQHFNKDSVEEILASLNTDPSEFAKETKEVIAAKSPVSVKVTLEQLIRYKNKSLEAVLDIDKILATNFLDHDDFYEGVRSVLIDKDKQPKYHYDSLEKVSKAFVNSFFTLK